MPKYYILNEEQFAMIPILNSAQNLVPHFDTDYAYDQRGCNKMWLRNIIMDFLEGDEQDIDLRGFGFNAYQVMDFLRKMNYNIGEIETNGWDLDYWIPIYSEDQKILVLSGCGLTGNIELVKWEE